jgi:hypothetical protein
MRINVHKKFAFMGSMGSWEVFDLGIQEVADELGDDKDYQAAYFTVVDEPKQPVGVKK